MHWPKHWTRPPALISVIVTLDSGPINAPPALPNSWRSPWPNSVDANDFRLSSQHRSCNVTGPRHDGRNHPTFPTGHLMSC